jgi:hypothetical protein
MVCTATGLLLHWQQASTFCVKNLSLPMLLRQGAIGMLQSSATFGSCTAVPDGCLVISVDALIVVLLSGWQLSEAQSIISIIIIIISSSSSIVSCAVLI